jgi:hypothetical protein
MYWRPLEYEGFAKTLVRTVIVFGSEVGGSNRIAPTSIFNSCRKATTEPFSR